MWKNHLLIAFRNLQRQAFHSALNLFGLTLGILGAILIYLYVRQELSYDQFYPESEQIYRMHMSFDIGAEKVETAVSSFPLASSLRQDLPAIEEVLRVYPLEESLLSFKAKGFRSSKSFFVDPSFFKLFPNTVLGGDLEKALSRPNSIVLTKSWAKKIFGSVPQALNKSLRLNEKGIYTVRAIVADPPFNTHFHYEALLSLNSLAQEESFQGLTKCWDCVQFYSYVKLHPRVQAEEVEAAIPPLLKKYISSDKDPNEYMKVALQSLEDIHLYSHYESELEVNGQAFRVYALILIGLFIVLLAAINYMNLATAKAMTRAKEIGVRKVLGSSRAQLGQQFLLEAFFMVFLASLLAWSALEIVPQMFSQLRSGEWSYEAYDGYFYLAFLGLILLVSLLSGAYPAWYLAKIAPAQVLKGKFARRSGGQKLRRALVVFQFVISTCLILSTVVIYRQINYLENKDLGFKQEGVFVIKLPNNRLVQKAPVLMQKFKELPGVKDISYAWNAPGDVPEVESYVSVEGEQERVNFSALDFGVAKNFTDFMGIPLLEGENLNQDLRSDSLKAVWVNQAFVKAAGWENAIGKSIQNYALKGRVVGVMSDFHVHSLHREVRPLFIFVDKKSPSTLFLRLEAAKALETQASIREIWEQFEAKQALNSYFLEQNFMEQYQNDRAQGQLFLVFSLLAIWIAILGLYGLSTFDASLRQKEIGVRKVLGASIRQIIYLLSLDFFRLVLIGASLALPLAYFIMREWLNNYAYRLEFSFWSLLIPFGLLALLSLLIINVQAIRFAWLNPSEVLKEE